MQSNKATKKHKVKQNDHKQAQNDYRHLCVSLRVSFSLGVLLLLYVGAVGGLLHVYVCVQGPIVHGCRLFRDINSSYLLFLAHIRIFILVCLLHWLNSVTIMMYSLFLLRTRALNLSHFYSFPKCSKIHTVERENQCNLETQRLT